MKQEKEGPHSLAHLTEKKRPNGGIFPAWQNT